MPKNIDIITILPKGFGLTLSDIQENDESIRFVYLDDESLAQEIEKSDIQIVIIDRDVGNFSKELYESLDKEFLSVYFNPIKLNEISSSKVRAIRNVQRLRGSIDEIQSFDIELIKENLNKKLSNLKISYLDGIEIKNYFSLKDIKIENLKDKKEIYFVGENGDGKTILLQAILLALKKAYSGDVLEHIREVKDMYLAVKNEFSDTYSQNVNINNIFAYGINRNKVDSKLFDKYGYSGLFDTSDPRKTTYLRDPFSELGSKYEGDNPLIKEFIEKLNTIILKENYQLFNGGEITFNELSEGYKSTVIWLYDLLFRLMKNQPEIKKLSKFKAIVLVDEVDLYLHPKWKYDFVYSLRKVFEDIQFIMITHSLVTILGASEDAVFYKVYKEDGDTKITGQIEDISHYTANILMTSPLFNLDSMKVRGFDKDEPLSSDDYIYREIHATVKEYMSENPSLLNDELKQKVKDELKERLARLRKK